MKDEHQGAMSQGKEELDMTRESMMNNPSARPSYANPRPSNAPSTAERD